MKKVYVIIREYVDESDEKFTDIIHICNDENLAVEKANEYIVCSYDDIWMMPHKAVWVAGKYYSKDELMNDRGVCYLSFEKDDIVISYYGLKIKEYELKED